jgi:hypothetical protein
MQSVRTSSEITCQTGIATDSRYRIIDGIKVLSILFVLFDRDMPTSFCLAYLNLSEIRQGNVFLRYTVFLTLLIVLCYSNRETSRTLLPSLRFFTATLRLESQVVILTRHRQNLLSLQSVLVIVSGGGNEHSSNMNFFITLPQLLKGLLGNPPVPVPYPAFGVLSKSRVGFFRVILVLENLCSDRRLGLYEPPPVVILKGTYKSLLSR